MKFTTMILAGLLVAAPAMALEVHGTVSETNVIANGQATPRGTIYLTSTLSPKIGTFLWAQVDKGYAQVYAGPSLNPTAWSSAAAGIGIEQGSSQIRFGSSLWLGHGRFSVLIIDEEHGDSGPFRKLDAAVQITTWLQTSWFADNILGSGPKATITVPHTPLQVWAVAQRDGQQAVIQVSF